MVSSHLVLFLEGCGSEQPSYVCCCVIPWPVLFVMCCVAQVVHIVGMSVG